MAENPIPVPESAAALVVKSGRELRDLLESKANAFAQVATRYLTPSRLVKLALVAASRNPRLLSCTKASLLESLMTAAQVGLEPNGPLQHAYLIPYRNKKRGLYECQFQLGYRGLMVLARRSGEIAGIDANVVHERDLFEYEAGTAAKLRHIPYGIKAGETEPVGEVVCFWAMATIRGEENKQVVVMSKDQVDGIRRRSKSPDEGPWETDYEAMGIKTALKRLCNRLPLTIEVAEAIEQDNKVEFAFEDLGARAEEIPEEPEPLKLEEKK